MGLVMKDDGWRVPDALWQRIEPLLPERYQNADSSCRDRTVLVDQAAEEITPFDLWHDLHRVDVALLLRCSKLQIRRPCSDSDRPSADVAHMTCCCLGPLERARAQRLPWRCRRLADRKPTTVRRSWPPQLRMPHERERPAASGEQGDGPDRSLAQGDLEEKFTRRVPSPAEVVMSGG